MKLAIAASFAAPAMLGVCIYIVRNLDFFDFCDLFTATSLVRATRPIRGEENEGESSGESIKRVTEGSNSNVDKSDRKSSNIDNSGRKSSNMDNSGRKSSNIDNSGRKSSNMDSSGRMSSNIDNSGRKSSNVDKSGQKSIQSTDSASGQK